MKFSFRQIMASTVGAVVAAVIASTFGVKGTIVGVAIGSAAATMATAFVSQSIQRGHEAVKQVVVKAPETSTLLRRLGGTGASGDMHASASSAPTEVLRPGPAEDAGAETVQMASTAASAAPVAETERLEISAEADAPRTERLQATTRPTPQAVRRPVGIGRGNLSWRAIAASVGVVFLLALLLITAIELISGKPLSAIFGGSDTGTSVKNIFTPTPAPSTTTSTTSTTSTSTPSSTTTTGATTSTTAPTGASTTTTTSPALTNTTTTVVTGSASTSTSVP